MPVAGSRECRTGELPKSLFGTNCWVPNLQIRVRDDLVLTHLVCRRSRKIKNRVSRRTARAPKILFMPAKSSKEEIPAVSTKENSRGGI